MLVTALRQTGNDRFTVTLEDGSELKTTLGAVTELRLHSGKDLDDEQLEELRLLSRRFLARDRALELISLRRMSEKELRDKLLQKGETEDSADYCVAWLSEHGFLNDADYAAAVARHYAAKGYGPGRVRQELRRRGVPREYWDEALGELPEPEDKLRGFIAARLKDPADRDQVRKVSAALLRRGWSWDEIRSALAAYNAEIEDY